MLPPEHDEREGGCVVAAARVVRVLPFVSDQTVFGNLAADVVYPDKGDSDVAVLRVGASSMPTVRLASGLAGTEAYSVLGFTRTPVDAASQTGTNGHFSAAGRADVKKDETFANQVDLLEHGGQGGPVINEQGQVVGLMTVDAGPPGTDAKMSLVGPDRIREALQKAGVQPKTGPVDTVYEQAAHDYKNALYAAALPSLAETLKLYPGHALAQSSRAIAQAKAGTADDKTGKAGASRGGALSGAGSTSGISTWVAALGAGGALVLLLLVVLLLRRRSRSSTSPPPSGSARPAGVDPGAAAELGAAADQGSGAPAGTQTVVRPAIPVQPGTPAPAPVPAAGAAPVRTTDPGAREARTTLPPAPRSARARATGGAARPSQPDAPAPAGPPAEAPITDAPVTSGSAPDGTARLRAGLPAAPTDARTRARAAAGSAAAFLGVVRDPQAPAPAAPAATQPPAAPRPCRVCGELPAAALDHCESCGYAAR